MFSDFMYIERCIGDGEASMANEEGKISVEAGFKIWYRRVYAETRTPELQDAPNYYLSQW